MNRTLPKPLRTALVIMLVVLAIAVALAVTLLGIAQLFPDELGHGQIHWGSYSVGISEAFSGGIGQFLLAAAAVTLAVLVGAAAVLFALLVTVLALTTAAGALVLAAALAGLPFFVIVAIVWLTVRHTRRHPKLPAASPGTTA